MKLQHSRLDGNAASELRSLVARSLHAARNYDGTEARFHALIESNHALEAWLATAFGEGKRLSTAEERQVLEQCGVASNRTINDMLTLAHSRFEKLLVHEEALAECLDRLHILHQHADSILLPPGEQRIVPGEGETSVEPPRFEPRVQRLVGALQQHGIFTDDLVVTTGILRPSMMRKESYALIEIPRIGREVLVCNQVGEATFVCRRHLGTQAYTTRTKEELGQLEGIERIVSPGLGEWEVRVIEALLRDTSAGETKKIDVRDVAALREEILRRYPTAKEFLVMSKKDFEIRGKKIHAVAAALGLPGDNYCKQQPFLALAAKIYGAADEDVLAACAEHEANKSLDAEWEVLENDPNALIAKLKEQYPTAKEFLTTSTNQKRSLTVSGKKIRAVAAALGLLGDDFTCIQPFLALAAKIYGAADEDVLAACAEHEANKSLDAEWEVLENDPNALIAKLKEQYPTAKEFLTTSTNQKRSLTVSGKKINAIATALGLPCDDHASSPQQFMTLAAKIYGAADEDVVAACREYAANDQAKKPLDAEWAVLENDPNALIAKLKEQYPTAKEFLAMKQKQKYSFQVSRKKMRAIAKALGLPSDDYYSPQQFMTLAAKIYGAADEDVVAACREYAANDQAKKPLDAEWAVLENDPDALIVKIQEQFPTAKEFLAMKKRQKDSFQVSGKKIDAIARALGLPSDDYVYPQPFMTLATKIYGANDPDICAAQERLAAKTEAATVVPGDGDEEQGRRAQKRRAGEPNWEQAV